MKNNSLTENEMVELFLAFFKDKSKYIREVPVFAKSVDLVQIDLDNHYITAIEFKKNKWRKAILQVLGSAIVFDYLEICILRPATEKCRLQISEECRKQGVGLYFLNRDTNELEHVVKPIHRSHIWEIHMNKSCNTLKEG